MTLFGNSWAGSLARIGVMAALGVGLLAASPVEARTYVHVGIGLPLFYGPAPYYYYPTPVYYEPAPVYYAPPAPAVQPAPSAAQASNYDTANCREYRSTITVEGKTQPSFGTACQQADGTWRIVR